MLLRIGEGGGFCECDNEPSVSMKCGEFIEGVKTCWFLRKDSVPWSSILLIKLLTWSFVKSNYTTEVLIVTKF